MLYQHFLIWKLKTGTFTETKFPTSAMSFVKPKSLNFLPKIHCIAIFATGTPVTLLKNGTVLEALGFTSST